MRGDNFFGVVLHPAWLWEYLLELFLPNTQNTSGWIEHNCSAAGRTLVDAQNVLVACHFALSIALFKVMRQFLQTGAAETGES